jgi:hypothetical protein
MTKAKQTHAAMRVYSDFIAKYMVMYLMASHVTQNIGVMYGPDKVVKGGMAVAFESSIRMDLKYKKRFVRKEMETKEAGKRGEAYGVKVLMDNAKNKVCAPFRFAVVDIFFDKGIDPYSGCFDHFFRKDKINLIQKGTEKKPEIWEWVEPGTSRDKLQFEKKDLPSFIIANDILGIQKNGGSYEPQLFIDEPLVSEEINTAQEINEETQYIPPPPPPESEITRSAKAE